MRPPQSLERRVGQKMWYDPVTGCVEWLGSRYESGYGTLGAVAGKAWLAHRLVYTMARGPIPAGLTLDHLCRNRGCVNPEHLEPVTGRVNILRGTSPAARNARKTHCANGHPFDTANTYRHQDRRICRACNRVRSLQHYHRNRTQRSTP